MNPEEEILKKIQSLNKNTIMGVLGLNYTAFDGKSLTAELPVTPKVHQPHGLLHGGVNAILAETVGSLLSALQYTPEDKKGAVGINIQVNHIKAVRSGKITAKATFLKKGKSVDYIEIEIRNDEDELTAHATMTNKIIDL